MDAADVDPDRPESAAPETSESGGPARPAEPAGGTTLAGTVLRLAALVALGFSAASATEDYLVGHSFCAPGDACDAVRASAVGQAIGKLLPALGLVTFGGVLLGSSSADAEHRRLALLVAMAAGVGAAGLLIVQAVDVGAFCKLCLGVDVAALVAAASAGWLWVWRERRLPEPSPGARAAWAAALVWAVGAPPVWATSQPPEIPDAVREHYKDGHVNVVEWSDFECPHCRRMAPVLASELGKATLPVNMLRVNFPLHGKTAARAYRCVLWQDEAMGETMAEKLFAAEERTKPVCASLAAEVGADMAAYETCIADPATDAAIEADKKKVREARLNGLPTVFIGAYKFEGFDADRSAGRYAEAIAAAGTAERPGARWMGWLVLAVAGLLAAVVVSRRSRKAPEPEE